MLYIILFDSKYYGPFSTYEDADEWVSDRGWVDYSIDELIFFGSIAPVNYTGEELDSCVERRFKRRKNNLHYGLIAVSIENEYNLIAAFSTEEIAESFIPIDMEGVNKLILWNFESNSAMKEVVMNKDPF